MKTSQKEVKAAIITLASNKEAYKKILEVAAIYQTIRMISYDLFIEEFDPRSEGNDDKYEAYVVIHEYAKEMKENGLVVFDEEFDSDALIRKTENAEQVAHTTKDIKMEMLGGRTILEY